MMNEEQSRWTIAMVIAIGGLIGSYTTLMARYFVDELPAGHRQVLALRFYADLPVRDIAEALDIPEGTVKSRLHAAVSALRTRLRESEVI